MTLRAAFASLFALLVLSLCSTAAAQSALSHDGDAATRAAIGNCGEQIGATTHGLPELERQCPGLSAALQAAGVRSLIIDSSRTLLDRTSLRQLPNMIRSASGPAPDVAALEAVLRGLHPTRGPPPSLWQRLWDWLVARLTPKQVSSSAPSWLADFLRQLSRAQWLWTAIIWGTCIALPISVAVIVRRELRAMGRRSIDEPAAAAETTAVRSAELYLSQLRQMPPGQRPAQLFAMLIARLVAAGRLPADRSLTHREVVRQARLDDAEQRRLIESLARLSERQLYSASAATPVGLGELLARGEDLYTTDWGRPLGP